MSDIDKRKTRCRSSWEHMRRRCRDSRYYPQYEKIELYNPWRQYENFKKDMGLPPTPQHSIDRIDNNRGYFPGNVRWATSVEQTRNRTNTVLLTINGKTRPMAEWMEIKETPVSRDAVVLRLKKGWSPEDALTKPNQNLCKR
jgi:hypothetical protein